MCLSPRIVQGGLSAPHPTSSLQSIWDALPAPLELGAPAHAARPAPCTPRAPPTPPRRPLTMLLKKWTTGFSSWARPCWAFWGREP